jgi:hypothetical protein
MGFFSEDFWQNNMRRFFKLYSALRNPWQFQLVFACIIAAGPMLLGYVKLVTNEIPNPDPSLKSAPSFESEFPFGKALATFFHDHRNFVLLCYFTPLLGVVAKSLTPTLDRKAKNLEEVNKEGLLFLLRTLNEVVGQKMETLGTEVGHIVKKNSFFNQSLFPPKVGNVQKNQITALVEGIHQVFKFITDDRDNNLRVVLFEMNNNQPIGIVCFSPINEGPKVQLWRLKNKKLAINQCAMRDRMEIIPNVRKEFEKGESRRFWSEDPKDGALICYPCHHRHLNETKLVVSIFHKRSNKFMKAEESKYEMVLSSFSERILAEYSQLVLNRLCQGN